MSHYIVVIPMHMCVIILVLFKKGHHPRTNIVKDEKGEMVAEFPSVFAR